MAQNKGTPLPILAGAAWVDITPIPGIPLTGYIARDGVSTGVHDRLQATALAFSQADQRAALLSCDLIGLDSATVAAVRQKIQDATGIPAQNVMLACTHTHSGPSTFFLQDLGDVDPVYLEELAEKLVEVTCRANAERQPVKVAAGAGELSGWAHDRRTPGSGIDQEVGVLLLTDFQGKPAAVLVNYACHPVVLGADNLLISADYPGAMRSVLQQTLGCPALFLTGAPGNVDPLQRGNFEAVQALGAALAEEALRIVKGLEPSPARLSVSSVFLDLDLHPIPAEETLCEAAIIYQQRAEQAAYSGQPLEAKIDSAMQHWAEGTLAKVRQGSIQACVECEIQALELGEAAVVGVAGELFSALGQAIKAGGPAKKTVLVSAYTNGDIGYIPTLEAYAQGGYEIEEAYRYYGYPAAVAPGSGERIVSAARGLLDPG